MLVPDACANSYSGAFLYSIQDARYQVKPNEPQYMYFMRDDVSSNQEEEAGYSSGNCSIR